MGYKEKMQFHPKDLSELDDLTEEHLGFSALSDGLGFAKSAQKKAAEKSSLDFEDSDKDSALKAKSLSGTGAVAAGPARFAPMTSAMSYPSARNPMATPSTPRLNSTAAHVLAEPAASQWQRVAAFLIDIALILPPLVLAWWVSFHGQAWEIFLADPKPPLLLFGVIFSAYFLLSESFGGQSLGKMLLGLRVVEDDKYQKPTGLRHAAARLALFYLGAACLGLGFLASFWDAKRRPWHDRHSGSIVRKKA